MPSYEKPQERLWAHPTLGNIIATPHYNQTELILWDTMELLKESPKEKDHGRILVRPYPRNGFPPIFDEFPHQEDFDEKFYGKHLEAWELKSDCVYVVFTGLDHRSDKEFTLTYLLRYDENFQQTKEEFEKELGNLIQKHKGINISTDIFKESYEQFLEGRYNPLMIPVHIS
ncbi:hypothetical protein COU57_06755 [Candidatus Pacearchaeota archaeon CG10_big_fil_rev_8_21_14_0_10_32_14]|nr:MAG: hypothetical protein COU57_06755 [Candidatus Pacearchaeota archaeon CG10_big_fil_rev_8_21_14_0_10_32_14]